MADPTNTSKEVSYLDMSDEEILNLQAPAPTPAPAEDPAPEEPPEDPAPNSDDEDDKPPSDLDPEEEEDKEGDPEDPPADPDAEGGGTPPKAEGEAGEKPESPPQADPAKPAEVKPAENAVDYKAEYERLLAPFKANGRDIQVKSVDEAVTLMQMGANYNKKMAALKPNLKLMKMLENNGLMSEEKISFLIDLEKKNPAAINKLVKDSGIDPMDLDAEKASAYKQSAAYTVDDREIELDTVLDELQDTPSYNRTLEIVSNKWDGASKQVIAANPSLLRVINDHVKTGIYDRIAQEIESERMFGRLTGLSDIEAYRRIGDALHASGAFNSLLQGSSQQQEKTVPAGTVITPKPTKPPEDDKLKEKRRAASSTKPAVTSQIPADFNPLALSDEEFSKLVNKQFL